MTRFLTTLAFLAATTAPAFADVDIQEVETPAGFTAWLVEEPSIPFVSLEIWFRGGTSVDAPGKRGAVNLMTALLEEGSGDLDARGFAEARDDLAASFGFRASDDTVTVSARFLSETTDDAVALLKQAITAPSMDPVAVERVRAQVLAGLRSDAEDPGAIASQTFAKLAFGDHPYGSDGDGTLDSVAALTREDLLAAHAGAMAQDRIYIGAAGDISPEKLAEVIDTLLADLPETGAPLPGPAPLLLTGDVDVVPFETPQSVIQFAQPGMARDDPDFFAAYVVNQIFSGGGFGARLMTEVREKRGLTYGIYAYLAQKDQSELLVGQASTANERAAETVAVIREEWAKMQADGPTQAELDQAKTYLTGAYPLRFDGNDSLARIVVGMQIDGLSIDYIATRNDKVEAVTLEDARRVAGELLDPDALSFVIVGQPEGLDLGN
ncbi:pitrilysin family protein [Pseudoruegeria sp. SK021]|uniref:M16 family metallopeptidase n=1 Tax=Pseudoruegeria sp. SK021 TaxID=1933035 RepID=UPI000A230620|nr:pitrilysin family protein [Pseudoruegeria sp. SK021]OSP55029.1 peptidase M16 [Pseudoruegeria sp. SK021]